MTGAHGRTTAARRAIIFVLAAIAILGTISLENHRSTHLDAGQEVRSSRFSGWTYHVPHLGLEEEAVGPVGSPGQGSWAGRADNNALSVVDHILLEGGGDPSPARASGGVPDHLRRHESEGGLSGGGGSASTALMGAGGAGGGVGSMLGAAAAGAEGAGGAEGGGEGEGGDVLGVEAAGGEGGGGEEEGGGDPNASEPDDLEEVIPAVEDATPAPGPKVRKKRQRDAALAAATATVAAEQEAGGEGGGGEEEGGGDPNALEPDDLEEVIPAVEEATPAPGPKVRKKRQRDAALAAATATVAAAQEAARKAREEAAAGAAALAALRAGAHKASIISGIPTEQAPAQPQSLPQPVSRARKSKRKPPLAINATAAGEGGDAAAPVEEAATGVVAVVPAAAGGRHRHRRPGAGAIGLPSIDGRCPPYFEDGPMCLVVNSKLHKQFPYMAEPFLGDISLTAAAVKGKDTLNTCLPPKWHHPIPLGKVTSRVVRAIPETDVAMGRIFESCAIIGSSGILNAYDNGAEIDAHDLVFRFNSAPVKGFEAAAGHKTTHRLTNTRNFAYREFPSEYVYVHLRNRGSMDSLVRYKMKNPSQRLYGVNPAWHKFMDKTFGYLSTSGLNGIIMAMHKCLKVHLYGFHVSPRQGHLYHYYNPKDVAANVGRDDQEWYVVKGLVEGGYVKFMEPCIIECHDSKEVCAQCVADAKAAQGGTDKDVPDVIDIEEQGEEEDAVIPSTAIKVGRDAATKGRGGGGGKGR